MVCCSSELFRRKCLLHTDGGAGIFYSQEGSVKWNISKATHKLFIFSYKDACMYAHMHILAHCFVLTYVQWQHFILRAKFALAISFPDGAGLGSSPHLYSANLLRGQVKRDSQCQGIFTFSKIIQVILPLGNLENGIGKKISFPEGSKAFGLHHEVWGKTLS